MAYVYTQNGTSDIGSGASAGRVGIGTASPAQTLEVRDGNAQVKNGSTNAGVILDAATNYDPFIDFKVNGVLKQNIFYDGSASVMKICDQAGNLHIGGTNVGMGTTQPSVNSSRLAVSATGSTMLGAVIHGSPDSGTFNGPDGGTYNTAALVVTSQHQSNGAVLNVSSGQTLSEPILYVTAAGKVGIGMTNPAEKLEVTGGVKVGWSTGTNSGTIRWNSGTGKLQVYNGASWIDLH